MPYGNCINSTGNQCSGRAQPGTIALRDAVRNQYPGIADWGIYNCRSTSTGSSLSTHAEGRGWDAGCNANTAAGLALGNRLADDLWANRTRLGIQRIIWNRRQIDVNQPNAWRAYGPSGNATIEHRDHLHIELCWASARDNPLTYDYVLATLQGHTPTPSRPTLRRGDRGPAVVELQQLLKITADGIFGPATENAVKSFQASKKLVVDGIVGPATWSALLPPEVDDEEVELFTLSKDRVHVSYPSTGLRRLALCSDDGGARVRVASGRTGTFRPPAGANAAWEVTVPHGQTVVVEVLNGPNDQVSLHHRAGGVVGVRPLK